MRTDEKLESGKHQGEAAKALKNGGGGEQWGKLNDSLEKVSRHFNLYHHL